MCVLGALAIRMTGSSPRCILLLRRRTRIPGGAATYRIRRSDSRVRHRGRASVPPATPKPRPGV